MNMAEYKLNYTAQEVNERLRKVSEIESSLDEKQDSIVFDDMPTEGSDNLVKSGDIYVAIHNATPNLTFDETPVAGSENFVTSGVVYEAIQNAIPNFTFDEVPTEDSDNLVTSGGVYSVFQYASENIYDEIRNVKNSFVYDSAPTQNSENFVNSGAIYNALNAITAEDVGALPNTTVIPVVPTNLSEFTNDVGYLTEHQSLSDYALKTDLDEKQDKLTFDEAPTEGSENLMTSGAIYNLIGDIDAIILQIDTLVGTDS